MNFSELKELSAKQMRKYRRTLGGAFYWCMERSYRPSECDDEIRTIADFCREESRLRWAKALEICGGDTMEDQQRAEELMGEWGYYPPSWIHEGLCKNCGPILTPYPIKTISPDCIFCRNGNPQDTYSLKANIYLKESVS